MSNKLDQAHTNKKYVVITGMNWNTPRHELHTPVGGSEPGVTGPIFWYVIAEVFLHNISSGVEIL